MTLNNPMSGKSFYDVWVEKFGIEEADKRLKKFKEKQSIRSTGNRNSMYGKPSPQGSGNGWSGWYKDWFFRSIHELSFVIKYLERFNFRWESAESSRFKIKYTDYDGINRNYFPDFIIEDKYLIECKPDKLKRSKNVILKKEAAETFCSNNNLKYKIITPVLLSEKDVMKLYKTKKIIFLKKYELKFISKYMK